MRHFRIDVDSDGLTEVIFDKADATTNTLSSDVFVELNAILDDFDRTPPKGVIIRSGKASGFIAGADDVHVRRFFIFALAERLQALLQLEHAQ